MLTEFNPKTEVVTAVITSPIENGEMLDAPIVIGYYPGIQTEIFLRIEDQTINVQIKDVPVLAKQLKRTMELVIQQKEKS